jgi:hypothetical protein
VNDNLFVSRKWKKLGLLALEQIRKIQSYCL